MQDRGRYTEAEVRKYLLTLEGQEFMLQRLAYYFAYIEQEYYLTKEFMFDVNKNYLHKEIYQTYSDITQAGQAPLLHHFPAWREEVITVCKQSDLLSVLMARLNFHVARRNKLDQVYGVTIDTKITGSQLSYVARLIGSIGAGVTAFRYMVFPAHLHALPRYGIENAGNYRSHVPTLYAQNKEGANAELSHMLLRKFNLFKQARNGVIDHEEVKLPVPAI
jgi:hypothetical protein